jgi:hypothetical protein
MPYDPNEVDISGKQLRQFYKERMRERADQRGPSANVGINPELVIQQQMNKQQPQYQPQYQQPSIGMFGAMNDRYPSDSIPSSMLDNYDYQVEIQKRDAFDQEGEQIGWNKTVTRFKTPAKADLTDEGMAMRDNKRKRKKKEYIAMGQND